MQVPSSIPEALVNLPQGRDSASRPIVVAAQAIDGQLVLDSRAAVLTLQPATSSGEGSETRTSLEADQLIRLVDSKLRQPEDAASVGQSASTVDTNFLKSLIDHLASPALKTAEKMAIAWPDLIDPGDSHIGKQNSSTGNQQASSVVHQKMQALYLGLASSGIFASRHLASVICGLPFAPTSDRRAVDFSGWLLHPHGTADIAKDSGSPLQRAPAGVFQGPEGSSPEVVEVDRSLFSRITPRGEELLARSKDLEAKRLNEWFASMNPDSPDAVSASNLLLNGRMEWAGLLAPGVPMRIERYDAWRGSHVGAGVAEKGAALRVEVQLPSLGVLRIDGAQWGGDLHLSVSSRDGQVAALAGWGDLVLRLEKSVGALLRATSWSESIDEADK